MDMQTTKNISQKTGQDILNAEMNLLRDVLHLAEMAISNDRQFDAFRKGLLDKYHKNHKRRILEIIDDVRSFPPSRSRDFASQKETDDQYDKYLQGCSRSKLREALDFLDVSDEIFEQLKQAVAANQDFGQINDLSREDSDYLKSLAALAVVTEMLGC